MRALGWVRVVGKRMLALRWLVRAHSTGGRWFVGTQTMGEREVDGLLGAKPWVKSDRLHTYCGLWGHKPRGRGHKPRGRHKPPTPHPPRRTHSLPPSHSHSVMPRARDGKKLPPPDEGGRCSANSPVPPETK
jgi:hypothetical protein